MVRNQCNRKWGHLRFFHHLHNDDGRRSVPARDRQPRSGHHRRESDYRNHRTGFHYKQLVGVLAVIFCAPAFANEPTVSNQSAPSAMATGNVSNVAYQFQNNGAPSRQYFGTNSSCNGSTMTFSPFYMGNDTIGDRYSRNNNWGAQLNFSVPLDGGMTELCKQIARRHEQKMRLDQALVRALKCGELQRLGFTFRPGSQYEILCNDIVPIVALPSVSAVQISENN